MRSQSRAQKTAISIITADTLAGIPGMLHGFSTRRGGVSEAYGGQALNLGITPEDTREAVERNRKLFLQALGGCSRNCAPRLRRRQSESGRLRWRWRR